MPHSELPAWLLDAIISHINSRYPLVHQPAEKKLMYGTAGFRTTGILLPPVAARVAIIAVLRAWQQTGARKLKGSDHATTVGFMITASHNPAQDNGFKIIDVDGGMLSQSWEPWCIKIANAATGEEVADIVKECVNAEEIEAPSGNCAGYGFVQLGRDTRGSGDLILTAAKDVLDTVFRTSYTDHGIVTTPQLHFIVHTANQPATRDEKLDVGVCKYYEQILSAFDNLMEIATDGVPGLPRKLVVDAANGVGAIGLQGLLDYAQKNPVNGKLNAIGRYMSVSIVNTSVENPDSLNKDCGAEFAHKKQRPSDGMLQWAHKNDSDEHGNSEGAHYYCLDGDADRVISFSHSSFSANGERKWRMIDGDRMSILYALTLHRWLGTDAMKELDVGIVQTAYANGASTEYVEKTLNMKVYTAATGVKHLHPIAHARDVGVYFEANGHGTVLFKNDLKHKIPATVANAERVQRILDVLPKLLSQVCGDAIADMLMAEVAMRVLSFTSAMWADLYTDRPALQTTVSVPNPRVITNSKDETQALTPPGLQEAINEAVTKTKQTFGGGDSAAARSFVRPSGTEPIVRVYAETSTLESTIALAEDVKKLVVTFCG